MKTESQQNFIQSFSEISEAMGIPRAAGSILAWLYICDPEVQSSDQLIEELKLARGSVSSMTRLLQTMGYVEIITSPGSRRRLYKAKPDAMTGAFRDRMKWLEKMRDLATKGLKDINPLSTPSKQKLTSLFQFYDCMVEELPSLLSKIEKRTLKK